LRYQVWAAGFAALVCLPFLPALINYLTASAFNTPPVHPFGPAAASGIASESSSSPWLSLDARWSLAIAALWLAASLLRTASLAAHAVRMRRLWNSAIPVAATGFNTSLLSATAAVDPPAEHYCLGAPSFRRSLAKGWDAMSLSLGRINVALRAPAELCVTTDLDRPCVIGFFRPRILIPAWLLNRLTPPELEQIVLHESEHLRRMDDWTNLLQKLCLVVFPLNPALWWLERRLCAEREMACDDGVVGQTQAPRAYAACLAGLAEKGLQRRQAALSLGAWQRRPELAERVHRVLRRPPVLSPAASAVSVALVGCGLLAGTFALAHSPQLVAFVAPVDQPSNTLSPSARRVDAGFHEISANRDFAQRSAAFADSNTQPFRAVKTLAILPATRTTFQLRNSNATMGTTSPNQANQAQQTHDSNHPNRSLAAIIPSAVAAEMRAQQTFASDAKKASQSAAPQNTQPQATQTSAAQTRSPQPTTARSGWIVLTTFEEVQTTSSGEAVQGDAVVPETHASDANTDAKTSTSITITRLVLRLVPPTSNVQPASNGQPASNVPPASNSPQPIAIPYRDGWLVIQL
jgi:hypothetical protein